MIRKLAISIGSLLTVICASGSVIGVPAQERSATAIGAKDTWHYTSIGGRLQLVDTLFVEVISITSFDPSSGLYTYSYTVKNGPRSQGELEWFQLKNVSAEITEVTSPETWALLAHPKNRLGKLFWAAEDSGPPPGWVNDGVSLYPSTFFIEPGDSLVGFGFKSRRPPGTVEFIIEAWEPLHSVDEPAAPPFRAKGFAMAPENQGK